MGEAATLNYYNENNPFAAQWLRELIKAGLIPAGDVDERSIEDVLPADLKSYHQCHFFAGIGGWPLALQLAGWPKDRPVWTGSPPCQPLSAAGKRAGFADERHLWPTFFWLISHCRPPVVFGEQVSTKTALEWWDLVADDLENANYATAAADLPASSVGAAHRRDRLFWVANAEGGPRRKRESRAAADGSKNFWCSSSDGVSQCCTASRMEYANGPRWQKPEAITPSATESAHEKRWSGIARADCEPNPWSGCEWIACLDGKHRPIKPGVRLLADGFSGRVGALRGFGNAIVPQLAAEFIQAYVEAAF